MSSPGLPIFCVLLLLLGMSCRRAPIVVPTPGELASRATIRRDTFGIPHILADTEEAAAFAFGYAQAEDHAQEIVKRMISARGEEARYFGESGLENDVRQAQFDNRGEAARGLTEVSPLFRAIVSAYAAGVNRYLSQHQGALPSWVHEITAADVLANSRAAAVNALAAPLQRQLREKYGPRVHTAAERPSDHPAAAAGAEEPAGSNAFALAGPRTVSGKPILLGNPHLNWSSLYWEAHVRVPGRIDFYGSTLVGIPVLRAGFNDRLGFVTTNNAPDLDDVYAIRLDPAHADHYILDGRPVPLVRRDVTIAVQTAGNGPRFESRTFWDTSIGPVIHRTADRIFAVKSSRLQAHRYFEGFYLLSRARNLDEWQAALRRNFVPTSNFTYADADGNILYQWNGQVPVRRNDGTDYRLDLPAAASADIWRRLHLVDELPRLLNPPGGYVQNANNPPQFVSLRDAIDMRPYPSYFERGPLALRPQRALELLDASAPAKFSVADVIRTKYDSRLLLADRVKPALLQAVEHDRTAPEPAVTGAGILGQWDNSARRDAAGALLFQRFWERYAADVRQPFATPWQADRPDRTPYGLADPAAAVRHLAAVVSDLRAEFHSHSIAWGAINRFRFGSLSLPGDGAPGTYGSFRVLRFDQVDEGPLRAAGNPGGRPLVGFGDAWVLLVDFAPPVTGWSVLAYGQTTDLASPHSRDQIGIFSAHQLRRAWYTETDIRANLEREYRP